MEQMAQTFALETHVCCSWNLKFWTTGTKMSTTMSGQWLTEWLIQRIANE